MKKCPFCAEEIQDAAIVCKHCHRDLVAAIPTPQKTHRGRTILLIVGILLAVILGGMYFGPDHQAFIAWEARRANWHQKCDAYQQTKSTDPAAAIAALCKEELDALIADAERHGWTQK
jgi:hypothetical protein